MTMMNSSERINFRHLRKNTEDTKTIKYEIN